VALTPEEARFLDQQRVGRLATVDRGGQPNIVPVCFALVDGAIYSAMDEKPKRVPPTRLRRIQNIQERPEVSLLVDRYDEDWTRLAWLQIHGVATLVSHLDERSRAIAALRARYPQYQTMDLESRPLIRIQPGRITSWCATPNGMMAGD